METTTEDTGQIGQPDGLTPKRGTYRVYKVFTVFLRPSIVNNLFNLCYSAVIRLFRDYSAGDAVSCIPCRVGLHVVGLGMNHERRAAITE